VSALATRGVKARTFPWPIAATEAVFLVTWPASSMASLGVATPMLFTLCLLALSASAGDADSAARKVPSATAASANPPPSPQHLELEYQDLLLATSTQDKDSLEAIRELHRQLDDDNDGTIEPSETGDFIKADLKYNDGDRRRESSLHASDAEITVRDLWHSWRRSEVFNWTSAQVGEWLEHNVELPQYLRRFVEMGVNGTHLPRVAAAPAFLAKVVGVSNSIHRSKIALKAMDLVLFGPPREHSNFWKDMILTSLLLMAFTGLLYAYRQNRRSQEHLQKMMADMDSLSKAEETLQELQDQLQQRDSKIESLSSTPPTDMPDAVEICRLKEELELLRSELHRAEVELEDKCWVAPPVLQHWLQLTYELETAAYNERKKAAEVQMEMAKDMCEKLKRKRSSLVGAFVSTHGRSIDDVDKSILEARTALVELTKDLTERSQRWRQIEMLCGCSIVNNPGVSVLQGLIRHVGIGRGIMANRGGSLSSRMSRSGSQEDLLDETDNQSVVAPSLAPSSSHTHISHMTSAKSLPPQLTLSAQLRRRAVNGAAAANNKPVMSRDSSKDDSSSSDERQAEHAPRHDQRASTPPVSGSRAAAAGSPLALKRSRMMVKSYSQDTGGSIQQHAAASAVTSTRGPTAAASDASMISSLSEGQLQRRPPPPSITRGDSVQSRGSSVASGAGGLGIGDSRPSVVEETLEESCSASESGSMSDLTAADKKKKRVSTMSFFNFRKKKERKDVM